MPASRRVLRTRRMDSLRVLPRSLCVWSIQAWNSSTAPLSARLLISTFGAGSASTPSTEASAAMPVSIAWCHDACVPMLVSNSKRRRGLRLKFSSTDLNTRLFGNCRWLPSIVINTVAREVSDTTLPSWLSMRTWSPGENGRRRLSSTPAM